MHKINGQKKEGNMTVKKKRNMDRLDENNRYVFYYTRTSVPRTLQ